MAGLHQEDQGWRLRAVTGIAGRLIHGLNGQVRVAAGGQIKVPAGQRVLGRVWGCCGSGSGLSHTEGLAVGDHDDAVVQEPKARGFAESWTR